MKNILFICSANVDRSKTAEIFYTEKIPSLNFKSAGTNQELCRKAGSNALIQKDLDWADMALVMETKHLKWIQANLKVGKGIIEVLNISDTYKYYSRELIEMFQRVCPRFF
ncbi:MAG: putative protein tyrosine phosphatase [Salibacteraceae bacterium]|jgi:predicted protein tyrosine phosphatase